MFVVFVGDDHVQLGTWPRGAGVPTCGDTVVLSGVCHDVVRRVFIDERDGRRTILVHVRPSPPSDER